MHEVSLQLITIERTILCFSWAITFLVLDLLPPFSVLAESPEPQANCEIIFLRLHRDVHHRLLVGRRTPSA